MIYELAYVLRTDATEEAIKKISDSLKEAITTAKGEILVDDAWGVKTFAQATKSGASKGNYFYVMYQSDTSVNTELERRLKINEDALKYMVVRLGQDSEKEALTKAYQNPNHVNNNEGGIDSDKEKKMFQKRKSCYFSAKKTQPDWKNPSSYAWLVNEFGKISPARVTGLRPKFQRMANTAIKRGRCMGMISYMSNHTLR